MSTEELREVIRDTVRETLSALGIDVRHPFEMQADLRALREWRLAMRSVRRNALLALVGLLTTGLGTALWVGIKIYLRKGE